MPPTEDARAALAVWRDGLINLGGGNRLINLDRARSGVITVLEPDAAEIVTAVQRERTAVFVAADAEEHPRPAGGLPLHVALEGKVMGPALRRLLKRVRQEYLDRGVSILYLAIGLLHWSDEEDAEFVSPLLLLPVDLLSEGPRADPVLAPRDDEPLINPALMLRLRELGVELPTVDPLVDVDLAGLWERVDRAIAGKPGWSRNETVVLSTFTFHKEAMFRDLLENEERVLANPLVQALTTKDHLRQTADFAFDPIPGDQIDDRAAPEDVPLVLDADSSQRACIAAAVAGRSFVMDGPPGTGKSQTIANMIGALLHAGKRVLFVSEKAAALEVVRNRLSDIGLAAYLLELHSAKAGRKEVAATLAEALDSVPVAPRGMDPLRRTAVRDHREQLNRFAEAMNRVRDPLGYNLHDVLGICSQAADLPPVPVTVGGVAELTPKDLSLIGDAAQRLQRSWRPVAQQQTYLWREVVDRNPLLGRVQLAIEGLGALASVVGVNAELVAAYDLDRPEDAARLLTMLDHARQRPASVHEAWLTMSGLEPVREAFDDLRSRLSDLRAAERQARAESGVDWRVLPVLAGPEPLKVEFHQLTAAQDRGLADQFAAEARLLERHTATLDQVADALRLPRVGTVADVARLAGIVGLARRPHRPEPFWFGDGALPAARAAADTLDRLAAALSEAEQNARRYFTEQVLAAPIDDLADRFENVHRGLRRLLGSYRRDKRVVGTLTRAEVSPADAVAHLTAAVAWKRAGHEFGRAEHDLARWLGRHWQGRGTDFAAVREALRTAEELVSLVPVDSLPAVVEHVCRPVPDDHLIAVATEARDEVARWQAAAPRELALGSVRDAVAWLREQEPPLRAAAAFITTYDEVTGRALDFVTAVRLGHLRRSAAEAATALAADAHRYDTLLGAAHRGPGTDESALAEAIEWAAQARRLESGGDRPLSPAQSKALAGCRFTEALPERLDAWRAARTGVVDAFAPSRHAELLEDLHDYERARDLLADLTSDSAGQEEWFSHLAARSVLAGYGLEPVVDFCAERRIAADQARPLIEATVLRAWADDVIRHDEALQPMRAEDRQHLITEYQRLDQELIVAAVSEIITSVNQRRPPGSAVGEPGLIRREGLRKRGHKPVRELISQARTAVLALKPCFMMSPLAVSQYLPPDLEFDVVIFDEASQVTPGDAVNCIYRGRALITAGDDRQLPPTSFFERVVEEDESEDSDADVRDYQSILELSKACGAFQNLGLRWHYRSRHEALIAFSNHAFYGGKLVTFPSANAESPDLGIALLKVDGIYRRGAARDNPMEAVAVADRVVHHFTTRPELSLGVVAFSVAQADAIEEAVDRALAERPDLERFRDDDRLNGFFVKNLEAVQGDERDVIIFSIGYGFDEFGKITVNFGALNRPKGWRRLNVAITRARQRVEVVSSIRAADIPETRNQSVQNLVAYLDYAERGLPALALEFADEHRDTDSPFEDSVLDTIRSWGFRATPQVGAAGYRIDIGVRHPEYAGEVYAIGVECDGAMYHSSPSARDRDRLREQILVGLGWTLHRIWGTAWYRHRRQEEERLRAAIEAAVAGRVEGRLVRPAHERPAVHRQTVEHAETPTWARPYEKVELDPLPPWVAILDHDMVPAVERLVAAEGPIHIAVVYQRMRDAWQIGRVGAQIKAAIASAIHRAHVTWDGTFLAIPDQPVTAARTPGDGVSRSVDQIADDEIAFALTSLVTDGGTVPETDLKTAATRVFGWARRGPDIDARFTAKLTELVTQGDLERGPDGFRRP